MDEERLIAMRRVGVIDEQRKKKREIRTYTRDTSA